MAKRSEPGERDEVRTILAANIRALDARIRDARVADLSADAERLQLKRLRTLAQLARQYRLLARDADVDTMEAEVDLLQEAIGRQEDER
jgi:HAMP domain-containing protein